MGKQVSPLRYPGGKARLYPLVSNIIKKNYTVLPIYCEPFAGGFGLGISLLLHDDVSEVIINDYDYCIYAFWNCIIQEELYKHFIERINKTEITIEEWIKQRNIYRTHRNHSIIDIGFATFFLNRCNRSGILDANPIGGMKQDSKYKINCRFHKENLIKTISQIHSKRERIRLYQKEAHLFLPQIDQQKKEMLINLDPPYFTAGPMLYKNNFTCKDHHTLAQIVHKLQNHWVMTYDDTPEIRKLYQDCVVKEYQLNYSLAEKRRATELIIYDKRLTIL